jgi:hypothetical protein
MTLTYRKNTKNSARFSNSWENFVEVRQMIKLFYGIGVAVSVGRDKTGAKLTVELGPPMG